MIGNSIAGFLGDGVIAATASFESIATATGTGASATITFSSIPSTYLHLQLRILGRSGSATNGVVTYLRFNGDAGNNYAYHLLTGDGTTAAGTGVATTSTARFGIVPGSPATAGIMGVAVVDIIDYASTSKYKTTKSFFGQDQNGTGNIYISSGLWQSTSAVNSITIETSTNWTTASTFALYGIKG